MPPPGPTPPTPPPTTPTVAPEAAATEKTNATVNIAAEQQDRISALLMRLMKAAMFECVLRPAKFN